MRQGGTSTPGDPAMTIIVVYCAFTYAYMLGAVWGLLDHAPGRRPWYRWLAVLLVLVLAPVAVPVMLGYNASEPKTRGVREYTPGPDDAQSGALWGGRAPVPPANLP